MIFTGFSPSGGHLEDSALRRRFYAAREQAQIKPLRFHDLRHSFGTLAVQVFPLSDVKAYMGHADIATTMIYVHRVPPYDAAAKLSAAVAQASGTGGLAIDPRKPRWSGELIDDTLRDHGTRRLTRSSSMRDRRLGSAHLLAWRSVSVAPSS